MQLGRGGCDERAVAMGGVAEGRVWIEDGHHLPETALPRLVFILLECILVSQASVILSTGEGGGVSLCHIDPPKQRPPRQRLHLIKKEPPPYIYFKKE